MIGDDEHGWGEGGLFNFEGGCYAKTINLDAEAASQIYATTRRFGTILERVPVLDLSRGKPAGSFGAVRCRDPGQKEPAG